MDTEAIRNTAKSFQDNHSIWDLGNLFQFLKVGMTRQELQNLLGKPTRFDANAGDLYEISDLRQPVAIEGGEGEKPITMPVYLQVEFDDDEPRKQAFKESSLVNEGLATAHLLAFALLPIGE